MARRNRKNKAQARSRTPKVMPLQPPWWSIRFVWGRSMKMTVAERLLVAAVGGVMWLELRVLGKLVDYVVASQLPPIM